MRFNRLYPTYCRHRSLELLKKGVGDAGSHPNDANCQGPSIVVGWGLSTRAHSILSIRIEETVSRGVAAGKKKKVDQDVTSRRRKQRQLIRASQELGLGWRRRRTGILEDRGACAVVLP